MFFRRIQYECPICGYCGRFGPYNAENGVRENAVCPGCGSLERHRLQLLVIKELALAYNFSAMTVLHVAPEPCIRAYLSSKFKQYVAADMDSEKGVDLVADLCRLPLPDQSFDMVFASHVLEHIPDEKGAMREVARVLRPKGIAVLPVPIWGNVTVEWGKPNPQDSGHVRRPGMDYIDRLKTIYSCVKVYHSAQYSGRYQTYIHERRSAFRSKACAWFLSKMWCERYEDIVPVCEVP